MYSLFVMKGLIDASSPMLHRRPETEDSVIECINREIKPILEVFDRARETIGSTVDLPIPTIVVIGDQSSGKSSVLESISQIVLPKGTGCVTKTPLVIHLRQGEQQEAKIYREDKPEGKEIVEMDEVDQAIIRLTKELVGD